MVKLAKTHPLLRAFESLLSLTNSTIIVEWHPEFTKVTTFFVIWEAFSFQEPRIIEILKTLVKNGNTLIIQFHGKHFETTKFEFRIFEIKAKFFKDKSIEEIIQPFEKVVLLSLEDPCIDKVTHCQLSLDTTGSESIYLQDFENFYVGDYKLFSFKVGSP